MNREPNEGESVNHEPSDGLPPDGTAVDGWPVRLSGITETIVATRGPDGRWNQAALGLDAGDGPDGSIARGSVEAVTARTFGRTRTRRNLAAGRPAYVQFTTDPLDFVEAALGVFETDEPVLGSTSAWSRVDATEDARRTEGGTEVVEWSLRPRESAVRERRVPTLRRGRSAVIEATVPASRLDVDDFDDGDLLAELERLEAVVDAAGDDRSSVAFERIDDLVGWRDRLE